MNRPRRSDPFLADIRRAVAAGHFDDRREHGPSELERMPPGELYRRVEMMSPEARRAYLGNLGRMPGEDGGHSPHPTIPGARLFGRHRTQEAGNGPRRNSNARTPDDDTTLVA